MATISRNLRLDEELWGDLTFWAEKDQRSLNSFISIQLKNAVNSLKSGQQIIVQDLTKPTNEIKPFEQPQTNYAINVPQKTETPALSRFEELKLKIKATTWSEDLKKVMKEVNAEPLPLWQKRQLEALALEQRKEFTN